MGTPEFAVSSLDILVKNGYDVVAVVTASDKYGGRGGKDLIQSAVKQYAVSKNIPVLQPEKLRSPDFMAALESYKADLQVVVAFRMLPEMVWSMPSIGTINLHGSLLPKYRGAAPIHWAVINGEKETGVTTFFLQQEIDTGDILMQRKLSIGADETTGEVHDRMMVMGAEVVLESVQKIRSADYILTPQSDEIATKAPKLFLETCEINFYQPAEKVHNFVRGMSPFPTAWTKLDNLILKIYTAKISETPVNQAVGTFLFEKNKLKIACADYFIEILELQLQGKKRMKVGDFLNGYKSN